MELAKGDLAGAFGAGAGAGWAACWLGKTNLAAAVFLVSGRRGWLGLRVAQTRKTKAM